MATDPRTVAADRDAGRSRLRTAQAYLDVAELVLTERDSGVERAQRPGHG
jgi:hypothetical protein